MSEHPRKRPTKTKAVLKREIMSKIEKVTNTDDLIILNKVIDKYIPSKERPLSAAEVFGEDWTNKTRRAGKALRGFRFREGLSQIDLAKALKGVKQSNISAWESGKEKIPKKRIKQLSKILNADLEKLLS